MKSIFKTLFFVLSASLISACGGGGGGTTSTESAPAASIAQIAAATPSGTTLTLDGSASTGTNYLWALTSKPAGSTATISNTAVASPTITPDTAGSYAVSLTVSNANGTSATSSSTFTVTAAVAPTIVLSGAEPLSGSNQISLAGTVSGSVTWYVDLLLLGSGGSGAGAPITWNTTAASNGTHLLVARIQVGTGSYQEIRRTVTVSNSSVTLSASPSATTGTIYVDARASSTFGISTVSGTFDGGVTTTLTSPNACSRYCSSANDVYRFTVNAAAAGSGNHSMVIVATDRAESTKTLTVPVPVSNAPAIALTSPADGAFVNGVLRLSGSSTSDKPGAVTTTAKLGDLQILGTTDTAFSTDYNISGIPAKAYTLTVTATDSTNQSSTLSRNVIITSSPTLAYSPVFTMPTGAALLAADGTQVLYSTSDGGVYLRDLVSTVEVLLQSSASMQYATDWQISNGRAFVQAKDADCTPTFVCIYMWNAAGTRTNLSQINPYASGSSYQENPVARGGYVVWTNSNGANPGSYTLYELATGNFTKVTQPSTINYVGNTDYDLSVVGGVPYFYYWGQTGGSGTSSTFDIYRWQANTGASTRVTSDGVRNIYPQTDGTRAVWQRSPIGGSTDATVTLLTSPLTGGASTIVATGASASYSLKDGVLVWTESSASGKTLKASTSLGTTVLSSLSTGVLYANGEGQVVYGEAGRIYLWNSVTGTRTMVLETTPGRVFETGGATIFTVNSVIYRVTR